MHHDIYLFTAEACTVYYGLSEVTWDLTLGLFSATEVVNSYPGTPTW